MGALAGSSSKVSRSGAHSFSVLLQFYFFRYAVQMLTPARILAETCGREKVGASDVKEVDGLFKDAKQSAQLLARSEGWLK